MGRPDGAHTHGSAGFDWRMAVIVASGVAILAGGGASGLFGALQTLLISVAVVLCVAVLAAVVVAWRFRGAIKRHYRPDYVRSMHGPSDRDEILDQRAALRREIALTRAARRELEIEARKNGIAAWHEDVRLPVVWAEVVGEEVQSGDHR